MPITDIVNKYEAQRVEILEPSLLIVVNRLYQHTIAAEDLYNITRGNWVLGARKAKAKYAFAVYNGIVRQVYEIHDWEPIQARSESQKTQERWRFKGQVAHSMQHYVGGSVEHYVKKGAQNPIKYLNC